MSQSLFRRISAAKPISIFVGVAILAFVLGFALTYVWARQNNRSESPATSLATPASEKERDGLAGPVSSVRAETARLFFKGGNLVEGQRELLEWTTYDAQGKRVDGAYYLVSGNRSAGKEEYAYDEKGNIKETTLRDENNAIIGKEVHSYEYDAVGNWTKMVTSELVYEGGKLTQQPVEVTYRRITYFFDQAISEIVKSATPSQDAQSTGGEVAALRKALNEWIAATNGRELEKLMGFYDSSLDAFYLARNVSREFVRAEKMRLFKTAEVLDVQADAPEITLSGDENTAIMRFRKQYFIGGGTRNRRGQVIQQLNWRRTSEGWKITGERDLQVVR